MQPTYYLLSEMEVTAETGQPVRLCLLWTPEDDSHGRDRED